MGIVAMKVLGAGMLGGFGKKDLESYRVRQFATYSRTTVSTC